MSAVTLGRVHASWRWKLFGVGVLLGLVAFVAWFGGANAGFPVILLIVSVHVVGYAASIMANGERTPLTPLPPFRLWPWLVDIARSILIGLVILFVAPRAWIVIERAIAPLAVAPADLARVALFMLWAYAMIAAFRTMRRSTAAE